MPRGPKRFSLEFGGRGRGFLMLGELVVPLLAGIIVLLNMVTDEDLSLRVSGGFVRPYLLGLL